MWEELYEGNEDKIRRRSYFGTASIWRSEGIRYGKLEQAEAGGGRTVL